MQAHTLGEIHHKEWRILSPPLPYPTPCPSRAGEVQCIFFLLWNWKPVSTGLRASLLPCAAGTSDCSWWKLMNGGWEVKKCLGINQHAHRCQSSGERCLSLSGGWEFNFVSICFHKVCMKIKIFFGGGVGLKVWVSYDFTQISNSTQLGGRIGGLSQGLAHARQAHTSEEYSQLSLSSFWGKVSLFS